MMLVWLQWVKSGSSIRVIDKTSCSVKTHAKMLMTFESKESLASKQKDTLSGEAAQIRASEMRRLNLHTSPKSKT